MLITRMLNEEGGYLQVTLGRFDMQQSFIYCSVMLEIMVELQFITGLASSLCVYQGFVTLSFVDSHLLNKVRRVTPWLKHLQKLLMPLKALPTEQ